MSRFVVGDVFDVLATLPDGSVDLVLTSPPFLALRSYLPADHRDKGKEIGSEPTPGAFIDTLLALTEEWARVLAPHGSICVELGDTYSGLGGAGGDYLPGGLRDGQQPFDGSASKWDRSSGRKAPGGQPYTDMFKGGGRGGVGWPDAKSLCLIPELYRISLVYGFNPLTGRTTPRWRARNVVRWCRPNPPVGALGDKFRPATSELVVACKSTRRYFDLDAVRTEPGPDTNMAPRMGRASWVGSQARNSGGAGTNVGSNPSGAPPLDWWQIPTEPFKGAHYACVDDQTEALTLNGWKPHSGLSDGDQIAAFDSERDVIVWQPATFHRYPFNGDLVSIEKRETSQRLTPNHRVIHRTRSGAVSTRRADEAKPSWWLPVAAPFDVDGSDGPGEVLAALLGWYVTEGSDRGRKRYIYQSESANPKHCNRIRDLLDAARATYTEKRRVRPTGSTMSPRESVEVCWVIEGAVADWLGEAAPQKRFTADFLRWSDGECSDLLDALIAGDGHTRLSGRRQFVQKDRATIDNVQALCSRLGFRSTISARLEGGWSLTVGERKWLSLRGTNGVHEPIGREHHEGVVWCPSVPASYWLARRNGRPFITGNTFPKALLTRPILAMSPPKVCMTCGKPSERIAQQTDEYKAVLNGRGGFDPESRRGNDSHLPAALRSNGRGGPTAQHQTLGWTDCGHDNWRPGLILDPFAGSGTTLAVATGHGRDSLGIDLDPRNAELARQRNGMFLTVEEPMPW